MNLCALLADRQILRKTNFEELSTQLDDIIISRGEIDYSFIKSFGIKA